MSKESQRSSWRACCDSSRDVTRSWRRGVWTFGSEMKNECSVFLGLKPSELTQASFWHLGEHPKRTDFKLLWHMRSCSRPWVMLRFAKCLWDCKQNRAVNGLSQLYIHGYVFWIVYLFLLQGCQWFENWPGAPSTLAPFLQQHLGWIICLE